jgi:hypothetical protein
MSNTIKSNQIKILKINNKTYLPYQLHQLPKYFDKYTTDFFNLKGYCYISLDDVLDNNPYFNLKNFKDRLTFNKDIHYTQKR